MRMRGKTCIALLVAGVMLAGRLGYAEPAGEGQKPEVLGKVRVLVVTGGHDFDRESFEKMFRAMNGLETEFIPVDRAFKDTGHWHWDAVVLYHMPRTISDKDRQAFLSLLDRGVGIVALHHAIAAWNQWPEYWKILGARYFLEDTEENGKMWARSTYQHDADIVYRPTKADHPVTAGLGAFTLRDETYKGFRIEPGVEVILEAEHEAAQREAGWVHQYRQSRVCYFQPGHGPGCFSDSHYQQLVEQAILWVSGRTAPASDPPASRNR